MACTFFTATQWAIISWTLTGAIVVVVAFLTLLVVAWVMAQ